MTPPYPYAPNLPSSTALPATPNALTPRSATPSFPAPANTPMPTPASGKRGGRGVQRANRQPSTNPDGVPSPLPRTGGAVYTPIGQSRQLGGATRQRFSGSGLTPRPAAQRQERRARRATLAMAGLAALLLLLVALLIYNPAALLISYGFAPGLRLITVDSHIPLILFGTPQPPAATPTLPPGSSPSPTAPLTTATSTATATNTPTPTVTDTPTPSYGATATVSFTKATHSVAGPAQIQGCPSGCAIPDTPIPGASKQYWESSQATYDYRKATQWRGNIYFLLTCSSNINPLNCHYGAGGVTTNYGCGPYYVNLVYPTDDDDVGPCTLSFDPSGQRSTWYNDGTYDVTYTYDTWSVSAYTYYYYVDYNLNCHNQLNDMGNQGAAWANSYISGVSGGGTVVSGAQVTYGNYICNPGIGYVQAGQFTVSESVTTYVSSGLAYHPGDAQNDALAALKAAVPTGYTLTANTTCSPSVASISGTTIVVNCQDTGTASYDWNAASDPKGQLAGALVGQSLTQALSICNSTAGVVAGSCKISITGGNTNVMPSAASQIQITPQ